MNKFLPLHVLITYSGELYQSYPLWIHNKLHITFLRIKKKIYNERQMVVIFNKIDQIRQHASRRLEKAGCCLEKHWHGCVVCVPTENKEIQSLHYIMMRYIYFYGNV